VAVTGIEIGAEVVQRKRDMAGRMRAIHDGDDTLLSRAADQLAHGENKGTWRGDVADDEDTRSLRHA
jgi:hypothetical protein